MTMRLNQITLAFPDRSGLEYRLVWARGGESEWRPAPAGFLHVPPAARSVEWRAAAEEAANTSPEKPRSRTNVV